jgi:hypothetical protein
MDRVILKSSRWHILLLLMLSLAFVVAGAFIVWRENALAGWTAIVFFGACAIVGIWQFIDGRPRLVIDQKGIWDRSLGIGTIAWADIDGAYVMSVAGNDFICLELREPERFVPRLSPVRRALSSANRALGATDFTLNLTGLEAETGEVFELILKRLAMSRAE